MKYLQENSNEKILAGVYVSYYEKNQILMYICMIVMFICSLFDIYIFFGGLIIGVFIYYCMTNFKKAEFGITENDFLFIRTNIFKRPIEEVNKISFEYIKYLRISKSLILGKVNLKISFIGTDGNLSQLKIRVLPFLLSKQYNEQKKSLKIIYNFLKEYEEKLKRGEC